MLVELKLKADEKLSFTAWRERWKPRIEQNFVKEKFSPLFFSYLIWRSEKRGELLLSLLCTMSAVEGWLLCMLFYRTHNQYYFNYTVEFFIIDKSFFFSFPICFLFSQLFFLRFFFSLFFLSANQKHLLVPLWHSLCQNRSFNRNKQQQYNTSRRVKWLRSCSMKVLFFASRCETAFIATSHYIKSTQKHPTTSVIHALPIIHITSSHRSTKGNLWNF